MFDDHDIQRCRDLLRQANAVLIAAGAGLAVEAGIDYMDTKSFARDFPGMVKLGFHRRAELMGYSDWSPELKWGYLAANVNQVRFQVPPHPVYARLLELVREKDYFVVTSNVDGLFTKNGFAEDRLFTPQGDYALMQCQTPCSNAVWPSWPVIERILPKIDPATQKVTDSSVLPRCPNCGEDVIMNVRGGYWFIEDPYREQAGRLDQWLDNNRERDLLVLEIGAGFNTPSVIRWPMERIVHAHPRAHLIRVNLQYPQVPREIAGKSISLQGPAMGAVTAIWKEMGLEKSGALT